MKLQNKLLVTIGIVWAVFLISAYIGSRYILIQSFLRLEQHQASRDLDRINQALDQIDYSLYTFTSDWGHWNDAYTYMQGKNPQFIPSNFTMNTFINSNINFITFWNNAGKLIVGTAINTETKKIEPFPKGIDSYLHTGSPLLDPKEKMQDTRGFILLTDGIMLLATSTVTDSNNTLPSVGTLVVGRYLTPTLIQKIAATTELSIQLFLPKEIAANKQLAMIYNTISNNQSGIAYSPVTDYNLYAFNVIRDIDNNPIGMLRITESRSIYMTGLKAIDYFLTIFILLGIIFSMLVFLLLHVLIIERLEHLNNDVKKIRENIQLAKRVDESGDDEIASLASSINAMLSIIQSSHEKLESHVEERTHELKETNEQLQLEITERKSVEQELITHKEHLIMLAHYDGLTSLPNRVFFNEILNKSISNASRHNKIMAVLFIDLDRFKAINDALGHSIGDLVLKEIASRFSHVIRTEDMLARLGGDEFILLLNDIDNAKLASPVAEKLLHACSMPIKINHHEFHLSSSIGISIYPDDGTSLEDLQKNADIAMYKAKKAGGNAYEYFTPEMNQKAHEHIKLEAALRSAINNNEFSLHYQPKYNLVDGVIIGAEALIRWESKEHGIISPAEFIPLAEETGLIMKIGEWALRTACKACKAWQDSGYQPLTIAVNISPRQFRHQNIADLVSSILKETNLNPDYLELEITETAVMDNVDLAINLMNEIKKMGVHIAIDDFGTGYTSISNLKHYPINILKIDQNFVRGIPDDSNDAAITAAVISLAHNLNMKVVAEGVETAEQLQYLADHDCDIVQGYFLSRPLPEQKFLSLLNKTTDIATKTTV